MRHLLAGLLTIFLTVCGIIGCAPPEEGFTGDDDFIDVEYSNDEKSITLYLEGSSPRTNKSRALTKNLAQIGYDYCEVVFQSGGVVTRTSWERGQSAAIRGVPRVAYPTDTVGADGTNAVLFVGKKSDKTLLAVGLISANYDDKGEAETPGVLTDHTASVTFALKALEASASTTEVDSAFSGGTLASVTESGRTLPMHIIDFDPLAAIQTPVPISYTLNDGINPYLPGVIVSAAPTAGFKNARVALGGGIYYDFPTSASATVTAGFSAGEVTKSYENDLVLTVTPTSVGYTGLVFKVPVHALTSDPSTVDASAAVDWFIRHGFGTNILDLDEGTENAGGALLLSIEDVP